MFENDIGYVEVQNRYDHLSTLPISDTRKSNVERINEVMFNRYQLIGVRSCWLIVSRQESRALFLKLRRFLRSARPR